MICATPSAAPTRATSHSIPLKLATSLFALPELCAAPADPDTLDADPPDNVVVGELVLVTLGVDPPDPGPAISGVLESTGEAVEKMLM